MHDPIRIGVAGAGVFGGYHAAKFALQEGATVSSVYDIDPDRAEALAVQCGAAPFKDYNKFLQSIDAVVIAAPASHHFALAEAALNQNLHLLVEKPLALSADEAETLVRRSAVANVILQVGHQERYACEAAGLFADSRAPLRVECVRRIRRTGRCEDVSVAFDLMVHDIDIVQRLTNSLVCSIRAEGGRDEISAELILENGTRVSLAASRCATEPERRMKVVYDDRALEFDFFERVLTDLADKRPVGVFPNGHAPLPLRDPLAYSAALFVAAIRGESCAYVNGCDGLACVDWAEKIEQAVGLFGVRERDRRERLRA